MFTNSCKAQNAMKIMDLLEVEVESAPQPQDFSQSS